MPKKRTSKKECEKQTAPRLTRGEKQKAKEERWMKIRQRVVVAIGRAGGALLLMAVAFIWMSECLHHPQTMTSAERL